MVRIVGTTLCLVFLALGFGQSSGQVLINEILADPASDWNGDSLYSYRDDEWVEIYNAGATTVDLSSYWLGDADSTLLFNFSGQIEPGRHRLVYGSDAVEWQRANGHSAVGLRLNNTGDTVMLWEVQGDSPLAANTAAHVVGKMTAAEENAACTEVQSASIEGDAPSTDARILPAGDPSASEKKRSSWKEKRAASPGGSPESAEGRALLTESPCSSGKRGIVAARRYAPAAKGSAKRVVGETMSVWSGAVLVDSYAYLSHEAEDDRSSGRIPDGGTIWEIFDGLNPYGGSQEPQGNGCLPSPGGQNGCPTPTSRQSWGSVKALYR